MTVLDVIMKSEPIRERDEMYLRNALPPDKTVAASAIHSLSTLPTQCLSSGTYNYDQPCQLEIFNDRNRTDLIREEAIEVHSTK
jgi:hypothetical protein